MNWITQFPNQLNKVYSQTYQDGVLEYIFKNIGTTNKFCIEFGFNSNELTGGSGSNVARLVVEDKWTALLLDSDNENISINLHKQFLTQENIGTIFAKYNVPNEPDYISIDVDSVDLWLFKGILESGYKPRLFSVEYNANFSLDMSVTTLPNTIWANGDAVYGASLLALNKVANEFDYYLITAIAQYDLFFIRKDLIDVPPPISDFKKFTAIPTHYQLGYPSKKRQQQLVEYPSMNPLSDDFKLRLGWV